MLRSLALITVLTGALLPALSYASDTPSISEIDVRPFEENSTDMFSILQILIEARQAFEKNDYETAARHYGVLVKYDPSMEEPLIGFAKSQLALNRSDLAQALLLKTTISTPEITVLSAIATAMNLPLKDAELHLKKVVEKHPNRRLWNLLGDVFIKKRKWINASHAFHSAEKAGQRPGVLSNNLGLLALHKGEFKLALQHLEISVLKSPQSVKFDNNRRLALLFQGDYISALNGLTQNRSAKILADAAIIASKHGDTALAKHLHIKAISMNPKYTSQAQVK